MLKKLPLLLCFWFISHVVVSQITITSPVQRQVIQRDLANKAIVTIVGSYSQPVDELQVRFIPVKTGQGTALDWTVFKTNPRGGLFKGTVTLTGGWYSMEVRGLLRGAVVGNVSRIERVGVGEVFVIAGQSNAGGSGLRSTNETASSDDRVNCANFINDPGYGTSASYIKNFDSKNKSFVTTTTDAFSIIEFSQLSKDVTIGPLGIGPYYWGKVGDALAAKLNVPIVFFNVAWGGASVRVWRESAENPTVGAPSDFQFDSGNINRYMPGYPYANLKAVLGYYGINMGIRAILWMEGETQNLLNLSVEQQNATLPLSQQKPLPVTEASYLDNLKRLITRTRQDLGNDNLTWVVARTSYSGVLNCGVAGALPPKPSPVIVRAQNLAIADQSFSPIFPGPFTDNIQVDKIGDRDQCVHFTGSGLDEAANSWINSLTSPVSSNDSRNFFDLNAPIMADTIPAVNLTCISNQKLGLSLPAGYSAYQWVSSNYEIMGNTKDVTVGPGTYFAKITKPNGNIIQIPSFTVNANTPPAAPTVSANADLNYCEGTTVGLTSSDGALYEWVASNSNTIVARTKTFNIGTNGTYSVRIIDQNACLSPLSNGVTIVSKPRPVQPTISLKSSTEFCDGQSAKLSSSNVGAIGYLWSNGLTTQDVDIRTAGTFTVRTLGSNGCYSAPSSGVPTVVNPLPTSPTIRATSDTVFCEGSKTRLTLTPANANYVAFNWERNATLSGENASAIDISTTALVKGYVVDAKGCYSKPSNGIWAVRKAKPVSPVIYRVGPYLLAARSTQPVDEYTWSLSGQALATKDTLIRAITEGVYTLQSKRKYPILASASPLVCLSSETSLVTYFDTKSSSTLETTEFKFPDDKGISIYPNPTSGVFSVDSKFNLEGVVLKVYTMAGIEVYVSEKFDFNSRRVLDLSNLPTGTYLLRVDSQSYRLTKQLIITR
ncbi:T9SS type A sorting domain-containing protein [Flectobacillus roseus]|uniref:T9SS type A sorting domain-containing protein n=1 Tax=Flectobacillus roseus TaxID=502259 RepID=A0ABT6YB52_9BACT|nr:T9SS type A sorting domain-containing protein [Flectobacillus roseus]MDI9860679.1 T9SS type A sorting domain-containing protein [Flectobacillus roseus]